MGLFDILKGPIGQFVESEGAAILGPALQAAGLGSFQELVDQLRAAGLDDQVQAWIHGQTTKPITSEEVETILNSDQIQKLAQHFGIDPKTVADMLAKILPHAVAQAAQHGLISAN